jgi:hypothetical protein
VVKEFRSLRQNILLSLLVGGVLISIAIAVFYFVVIPTDINDIKIRLGNGTQARAVVESYSSTVMSNDTPLFSLALRIYSDQSGVIRASTKGAFSEVDLRTRGIWGSHEPEVIVRYIDTRAIVDGQPIRFPVSMLIALIFGGMGIVILVATVINKPARQNRTGFIGCF